MSKLEHAAWQNGAHTPILGTTCAPAWRDRTRSLIGTACARSLGASSPRKVDGTRQSDGWWVPAGFSRGPIYKSRSGLFIRPGQIQALGAAGESMGSQDVSSRAVSKDSQRLRDRTPDEPVDDLIKSIADSHKPFPDRQSSQFLSGRAFFTKQIADRPHAVPLLIQQIADSTQAVFPLPSWGSLFLDM